MTKKQIKKLANLSYNKNNLNINYVDKIVKILSRSELKTYIKAIKNIENNKTITLITSDIKNQANIGNEVKKLFPDKKIIIKEDKSMISGIRLINKDTIYDFNLKNTLENLVSYINQ